MRIWTTGRVSTLLALIPSILDGEIFEHMKAMNNKREYFESLADQKKDRIIRKIEDLDKHKEKTFDQIDKYFEELI